MVEFEYIKEKHTKNALVKIVEKILTRHNIQTRILITITNNVFNNIIFFYFYQESKHNNELRERVKVLNKVTM